LRILLPWVKIAKIYGGRHVKKGRRITIRWETATEIEIGWNERGIIDDIVLIGPE
jgi:hypothetical protein